MIEVNLIDEANALSPTEFARLKSFIVDHCRSTSEDIARLHAVRVRDDGASGYLGYWTGKYTRVGADVRDVKCVIVLNAHYLTTVEQLERTLAHEFGHHVTLGNLMDKYEMIGWFTERAPWLYYRVRGLDPKTFAQNYSKGWHNCDKEVLAEDYKFRFSPYTGMHRMKSSVGNPTTEVGDYLSHLAEPYWC
jgi:hypothetical protein